MDQRQAVEPVRLVVWDLDETFWDGTLTEGGIDFLPQNREIVIELARRGIMSSVCSKNDFAAVREILQAHAVWDYFIFPSINWEPKGPRLRELVEAVQLRPETVLLIDDNPANLAEAQFLIPGIQVASEAVIPELLHSPLLRGKDDTGLSRLKQYKLLEQRKVDERAAAGDSLEFLRASRIRVQIEYDVEAHIDRALELINRTNQLNFTKCRLSEDRETAREEFRQVLREFDYQIGLVRVRDNYGDHGYCGLFAVRSFGNRRGLMLHFCFSCRILGMGVEAFVYQLLGRPEMAIAGDVLSDPIGAAPVDWIELVTTDDGEAETPIAKTLPPFFLRGGCDLSIFEHYARTMSPLVEGEYYAVRNGIALRLDHSVVMRYAIEGLPAGAADAAYRLGYAPEDFRSALFNRSRHGCWVLSLAPDQWCPIYRHNGSGALLPFFVPGAGLANACELAPELRAALSDNPPILAALDVLASEFSFVGSSTEKIYKENLAVILGAIPRDDQVFVILNKEFYGNDPSLIAPPAIDLNRWTQEIAARSENVHPIQLTDFAELTEMHPDNHFDRMVYRRLFDHVRARLQRGPPAAVAGGLGDRPAATFVA